MSQGEIVQVIGPVVDVKFPIGKDLPDINNALKVIKSDDDSIILEVTLEQGDGVLRCIAMESGDVHGGFIQNTDEGHQARTENGEVDFA